MRGGSLVLSTLAVALSLGASASAWAQAAKTDDAQQRRRHEIDEPRPPPSGAEEEEPMPWGRRVEIGGDFAFVLRPFAKRIDDRAVGYEPAPAWAVHVRWKMLDWLRFHAYFMDARHALDIPADALVPETDRPEPIAPPIARGSTLDTGKVQTFVFGARLAPTLEFNDRWRAWLSAGVGWGRFNFPEMTVTEPSGHTYVVRSRSGSFVEIPLGLGVSFDVIERWLAIEYEATGAPLLGQSGEAHEVFQAVDDAGEIRDVGPFGAARVSFVQTLGLSLIL